MSAMENMLASMLSKMMPPELLVALSPENLQKYSEEARALIVDFQERLSHIEQMQMQNNDLLNQLMERVGNDGCKYTGGKRTGSKPVGSGDGNTFIG
jgi:hypothetical protein